MDDLDKPKETPEQRAQRKWGNNDVAKRFRADKKAAKDIQLTEKKEPVIGKAIVTERPKAKELTKFERRFVREIREMLEGHKRRNELRYKLLLMLRRDKLRAELKRRQDVERARLEQETEFLTRMCEESDMPTMRSVNDWLKRYSDFRALHDDAVNDRLNRFEDDLITIADESENDFKIVKKGNKTSKVVDAEVVSRAKLRIDVPKAHLKAYRPERWSEQSTLNVNNNDPTDVTR